MAEELARLPPFEGADAEAAGVVAAAEVRMMLPYSSLGLGLGPGFPRGLGGGGGGAPTIVPSGLRGLGLGPG